MIDDIDIRLLESRKRSRFADLVSEVFSPPIVVVALLTAVSLHSSPDLPSALGWIALTATFCAGIPYLLLLLSVRAGHVADRHLVRRVQRRRPLVAALFSLIIGLVLLSWFNPPQSIAALVIALVAGLIVLTPFTVRWKASMHAAVVAGALAVVASSFGPRWMIILAPALPLVSWARIHAGRHTAVQVALGSALGYIAAWTSFAFQA